MYVNLPPHANYWCPFFMLDYVENSTWEFVLWKLRKYNRLKTYCLRTWYMSAGLYHSTLIHNSWSLFSYCCYRYMYEHTYMRTYIYTLVNSFSIACVSMCPELTTWDWRTSVEGYPWRKSSPSLSSNWLLNPGSSTSDLPLNQYGNSNSSRDRNMWNFPCPGCHVNWCH